MPARTCPRITATLLLAVLTSARLAAQSRSDTAVALHVGGYAIANYYAYDWQTDPALRNAIDLERAVIEPSYRVSPHLRFEAEVEFEHGGTGATMEFDPFEESGEFEQEIEKGGEVEIEKLQADFTLHPALNVLVGELYVPVGLVSARDDPDDYFTNTRNEAEAAMIPTVWHSPGVGIYGRVRRLRYRLLTVAGLDATGFTSGNWVRYGEQGRFETVNAQDMALVGRLDLILGGESTVGVSGFYGNSSGNRPKPDLTAPAYVTVLDAHAAVQTGRLRARGLLMYGHLQNADLVSDANRNLSNNLGVKRDPVGSAALAWFAEAGYRVLERATPLDVFARYDWYDTMYRVTGDVFDNPRWARHTVTAGLNWYPDPHFIVKASYAWRVVGLPTNNQERTTMLGVAALF